MPIKEFYLDRLLAELKFTQDEVVLISFNNQKFAGFPPIGESGEVVINHKQRHSCRVLLDWLEGGGFSLREKDSTWFVKLKNNM